MNLSSPSLSMRNHEWLSRPSAAVRFGAACRASVLGIVLATLMAYPAGADDCVFTIPVDPIEPDCSSPSQSAPDFVPLYRLYSGVTGDHRYTTSEQEKDELVANTSYVFKEIEGYLYKCPQQDTIALHRRWNCEKGDTFLTASTNPPSAQDPWFYEGILGYVYPQPPGTPETLALNRFYTGQPRTDHFYSTDSSLVTNPPAGWIYDFEKVEGYIFDTDLYTFLRVEGDKIMHAGEEVVLRGATLTPFYSEFDYDAHLEIRGVDAMWHHTVWDSDQVRSELQDLASKGANAVRIFAPATAFEYPEGNYPPADPSDPGAGNLCIRVHEFLDAAKEEGLRVIWTFQKNAQYKSLFREKFCEPPNPPDACDNINVGAQFDMLSDGTPGGLRDFMIQRAVNLIEECELESRPEIAVFSFWNEMKTHIAQFRNGDLPLAAWNAYLADLYPPPLDYKVAAPAAWGYQPGLDCGSSMDQLCAPDDVEFCTEGAASLMAIEYRRFADGVYREAFADLAATIRLLAPDTLLGTTSVTTFKGDASYHERFCAGTGQGDGSGYSFDPRGTQDILDVIGLNQYPWKQVRTHPDDVLPPGHPEEGHKDNFLKLGYIFDYARTNADGSKRYPVYVQETGYDTRCQNPANPNPPGIDCPHGDLDPLQEDVLLRTVEHVTDSHLNGMLIYRYRDAYLAVEDYPGTGIGLKRIEETAPPRDAYFVLQDMMDDIGAGRDSLEESGVTLSVDPYAKVLFPQSLLEKFDDWLLVHDAGIVTLVTE